MRKLRYGLCVAGVALFVSSCAGTGGQATSDALNAPAGTVAEREAPQDSGGAYSARAPKQKTPQSQGEQVKLVSQDRSIIYIADMTVRAKDVTAATDRARQIVTAAGGHLATEKSDSGSGDRGSASLVFKIPPAAYPGVLDRLGRELGKRESLQQNTEDVTEQVADVESRIRSSQAALDSLRTLMKKAKTIGEVLDVEREISTREADLEALQARQKTLASQTSMATLTLNLVGPAIAVEEPDDEPAGFLGGLRAGWRSFVTAIGIGLTVLGALLPWLILVAVVWLLVLLVRRFTRRAATPGTTPGRTPVPAPPAPGMAGPGGKGTAKTSGPAGTAAPDAKADMDTADVDTAIGHRPETGTGTGKTVEAGDRTHREEPPAPR